MIGIMEKCPTIRDVAKAAGVSRASAQRALAHNPRCSEKTRLKVFEVAKKLGYRPDPIFASMGSRRKRSGTKGTPLAYLDVENGSGGDYYEDAAIRAQELGYHLQRLELSPSETTNRVWDVLFARGVVGVLIGRISLEKMAWLEGNDRFPVVNCGKPGTLPFHVVRPRILTGVIKAWDKMMEAGYRRIGAAICQHPFPLEDDITRHAGIIYCQQQKLKSSERIPPLLTPHLDLKSFQSWVKKYNPEAVLGFSAVFYFCLQEMGYKIPEEIGFASLHLNVKRPNQSHISGLNLCDQQLAIMAVNLLDQLIRQGERGVPQTPLALIYEPSWSEGTTLQKRVK